MPMSACCTKGKFYANFALLYSKGSFYAIDFGIKSPHVASAIYQIVTKGNFYARVINS